MSSAVSQIRSLAEELLSLFKLFDKATGAVRNHTEGRSDAEESVGDELSLSQIIANQFIHHAVFPVYGVVKAGKSTFLASLIGEKVLPEQALPMTSIPIKIRHIRGCTKRAVIPLHDNWNACVAGFRQQLLAGTLRNPMRQAQVETSENEANSDEERIRASSDRLLFSLQERVRANGLIFEADATGDGIRTSLDDISHFVRLLWLNEIDFEEEYGISLELEYLPTVEISMKAFESYGDKEFSFLDTPGPNEAKALTALTKMAPKVMKSSSGCVLCIPWDAVESDGGAQTFSFVNTHLYGKRIVVVITRMDCYKDNSEGSLENLKAAVLQYFVPIIRQNVVVHLTSGHQLYVAFKVQNLLKAHPSSWISGSGDVSGSGGDASDLYTMQRLISDVPGLFNDLNGYLDSRYWNRSGIDHFVETSLNKLNAAAVLNSFSALYNDAEVIALQGHLATVEMAHGRWKEAFGKLEEFVSSNESKRAEVQRQLEEVQEVYGAVVAEMNNLPSKIETAIASFLEQKVGIVLREFAEKMNNWRVVYENPDGSLTESDIIEFCGGKGQVQTWFNSDRCKGKLLKYVKDPTKSALQAVKKDLPGAIQALYSECAMLVERVKSVVESDDETMDELQVFFSRSPEIALDIERTTVNRVVTFDVKKISYEELPDKCLVRNEVFTKEVYQQFKDAFEQAIANVSTIINSELSTVLQAFCDHVEKQKVAASQAFQRNQEVLQKKLEMADIKAVVDEAVLANQGFETSLQAMRDTIDRLKADSTSGGAPPLQPVKDKYPKPKPTSKTGGAFDKKGGSFDGLAFTDEELAELGMTHEEALREF